MDIEKTLGSVEQMLERLTSQHEQEQAMQDVLPQRFAMNMEAFKRLMPDIYNHFKDYQPQKNFRLFCNENGIPNLLWLDDQIALYGPNPYDDAESQINDVLNNAPLNYIDFVVQGHLEGQIHIKYNNQISKLMNKENLKGLKLADAVEHDIPLVLMYGIGLGYQLGYLYERCKVKHLFAFEPDVDVFYASIFCFDWHSLLSYMEEESMSLHFFIGVDEKTLVSDMMEALHRKGAFWSASYFSFLHYHSEKIHSLVEKVEREFYLLKTGWGFFDDSIYALAHSYQNLICGTPMLQKNKNNQFSNIPVFVVGNGPSLDDTIDFIASHSNHALIIACGTAISALYKAGIKPDIYVAVERTKSSADFLDILNANEFLKDITFLSVDVIHPECRRFFKQTGLVLKPNEPMFAMLYDAFKGKLELDSMQYSNPFVGNTGLNYAAQLGFKNVYLFGVDNGYKDISQHHSSLSLYYNDEKKSKMRTLEHETFPVRGNFGGEVRANNLFGLSIHNMENVLRDYELACFNCSDGAYIDGAKPTRVENLVFTKLELNKMEIVDAIMEGCFSKLNVDELDMHSLLDASLFNDVLEKLRSEWNEVELEYNSVLSVMQRHHDYLLFLLLSSNKRHFYRMLVGSINYFYANIISLMNAHLNEPDETFKQTLTQAISILECFFTDAAVIYADAFEKQDTTYFTGLNVFKH